MAQVIYSGSINDEVSKTTTARIQQATADITPTPTTRGSPPRRRRSAAAQSKEASLQRQVTNSAFLSQCEAGETSCSQTHKLGCGPYCKRDARRAAAAAAALRSARPEIEATIAADRHRDCALAHGRQHTACEPTAAIKADRDFLSRQAALERVERANPAVRKYVLFFLAS